MLQKKDIVKIICTVEREIFYKEEYGIIACSVDVVKEGTLDDSSITIKGIMARPVKGCSYQVVAEKELDPKYGTQYKVISMCSSVIFGANDKSGQKKYLCALFTENQVANMYAALKDPFQTLKDKDTMALVQVKGCGMKTAVRWCDVFHDNYAIGKILVDLDKYNLTNSMVQKLLNKYKSPDLVVGKVTQNPYVLCAEVGGIGWKTVDKIALNGGLAEDSPERITAYIRYYLGQAGESGCSWITPDELLGAILDNLGEEISDEAITEAIHSLEDYLWWNDEKTKIGLRKYFRLENNVAQEILRIRDAKSKIQCTDWEDKVRRLEAAQGWSYTNEQRQGIQKALENNIVIICGYAGTGKSTLVSALINILSQYSYVQCALSGRASSRMTEITGEEGYTIHRLLGYPQGDPEKGLFVFHDENPLPYDIFIVDEISMVDVKLFNALIRAIPSGSKIICLGDTGQLEAIGCGNLAYDMIHSQEVSVVSLTQIHRQAAKSAIITDSIRIRMGEQIIGKNWVGDETRGELKDLRLKCFSDASNTYYEVMKAFSTAMNTPGFDITETQVIVPVKNRGYACTYELNNSIQELYNPASSKKEEVLIHGEKSYYLRVGDKVLNTKNTLKTKPAIFNGNLGIIKSFDFDDEGREVMVIDFIGIGTVEVPKNIWNSIELGYAITVHKFQGSQADHVIFGMDFNSYALLTRELLYTAITRAKKYCEVTAQTGALRMASAQEQITKKQTHLQKCLYDLAHPKLIL